MTFGSRRLSVHLIRGVGGFVALGAALATMNTTLWPSLVLLPVSLYLLRGCPMCWTIGLFETLAMRFHQRLAGEEQRR